MFVVLPLDWVGEFPLKGIGESLVSISLDDFKVPKNFQDNPRQVFNDFFSSTPPDNVSYFWVRKDKEVLDMTKSFCGS